VIGIRGRPLDQLFLLGQAALVCSPPPASWAPLVSSLGYSTGFVMMILARKQLFAGFLPTGAVTDAWKAASRLALDLIRAGKKGQAITA
jgi:hypothetical protein